MEPLPYPHTALIRGRFRAEARSRILGYVRVGAVSGAETSVKWGVPEREDAAVGRLRASSRGRWRSGHADDGFVERVVSPGAVEAGVSQGEDAAIGS